MSDHKEVISLYYAKVVNFELWNTAYCHKWYKTKHEMHRNKQGTIQSITIKPNEKTVPHFLKGKNNFNKK